jgi:GNAT superfamily N-acetyltransferase
MSRIVAECLLCFFFLLKATLTLTLWKWVLFSKLEERMETKVIVGYELRDIAHSILLGAVTCRDPLALMAVTVIGGDRIACCDEGVVFVDDPYRGIATIAPEGEWGSDGTPSIVGIFVREVDRHQGYATVLTEAVVRRCVERGFARVHVDVLSRGVLRAIEKLPAELWDILEVVDQSSYLPL